MNIFIIDAERGHFVRIRNHRWHGFWLGYRRRLWCRGHNSCITFVLKYELIINFQKLVILWHFLNFKSNIIVFLLDLSLEGIEALQPNSDTETLSITSNRETISINSNTVTGKKHLHFYNIYFYSTNLSYIFL